MFKELTEKTENVLAWTFGCLLILMSAAVGVEVVVRKAFNFSLQGTDELSGYILAIGSTITFGLALAGRAHIRVDLLHALFPRKWRAALNMLAMASLCLFGVFLLWMAVKVLQDTIDYGSTAATSWGTPLLYPQSVWILSLFAFTTIASVFFLRSLIMLVSGRIDAVNTEFQPKGAKEELEDELASLTERQSSTSVER